MLNEMCRENAEKFEKDFDVLKQQHSEAKEPSKVKALKKQIGQPYVPVAECLAEIKRKENEAEALAREHEKLNKKVLNNERQMGELTAELRIIKSKKLLSDREDLQSLLTVIMLNRVINGIAGELAAYMGNSQNDEKEKGD